MVWGAVWRFGVVGGMGEMGGYDKLPLISCFLKTVLIRGRMWPRTETARKTHAGHKSCRCRWNKSEEWDQEILEGRRLRSTSGWLIIALIREQRSPNNTQANSALARVLHLQDPKLPHELQLQMKYYWYYWYCFLSLFLLKAKTTVIQLTSSLSTCQDSSLICIFKNDLKNFWGFHS